jgi:hypothetical protein
VTREIECTRRDTGIERKGLVASATLFVYFLYFSVHLFAEGPLLVAAPVREQKIKLEGILEGIQRDRGGSEGIEVDQRDRVYLTR